MPEVFPVTLPIIFVSIVPVVIVRLLEVPVSVVVPKWNLSLSSSHAIIALLPVEPLSIIIPASPPVLAPLASSIILSEIVVLVESTVVVVPVTFKLPAVTVPVVVIPPDPTSIDVNPDVIDPAFNAQTVVREDVTIFEFNVVPDKLAALDVTSFHESVSH